VESGSFREDLLFRLNVHVVRVPPLRERPQDVPDLVRHFVRTLAPRLRMPVSVVTDDAMAALQARTWARNNVRELRNTVERMMIASQGPALDVDHVPGDVSVGEAAGAGPGTDRGQDAGTFQEQKRAAERRIIEDALDAHDWQITETAAALGLADHASLLKIMRRHYIRRP
jgi:DNA-binding NtrC family response regulator